MMAVYIPVKIVKKHPPTNHRWRFGGPEFLPPGKLYQFVQVEFPDGRVRNIDAAELVTDDGSNRQEIEDAIKAAPMVGEVTPARRKRNG